MTEGLPISEAGTRLDELVHRARSGQEHIVLTEDDRPVAAIVDIDVLRELQQAQDDADIALCIESEAHPGPRLTHEEFMAVLEAEDAADRHLKTRAGAGAGPRRGGRAYRSFQTL